MHTYKQLTYIVIFTLLFFGAVSVQAQTEMRVNTTQQTEVRTDSDTDEKCEAGEECPEEDAERTDANDADAEADGYGDAETHQRCEDGVCTEAEQTNETQVRTNEAGEYEAGDSESNADVSADADAENVGYNNSRSNRATVVSDGEEDDQPEQVGRGITKEIDKASPKLIQSLRIDEDSPLLNAGVELRMQGEVCDANDEDCDDDGVSTPLSPQALSIYVSGETVRGWDPDKKAELTRRLQAAGTSTSANDFGLRVAQAAINNDDVTEIETDDESTAVRFNTRMRLFGFIPTQVNATARADADGEVTVDYPWYSFFASKGDGTIFTSLAAELRAAHEAMISVEEEGAPRTIRSEAQED